MEHRSGVLGRRYGKGEKLKRKFKIKIYREYHIVKKKAGKTEML